MIPRRYATCHMLIGQAQVHCQLLSIINCSRKHPSVIIQLMTFDGVNTRIVQPMEHDIHRGIRGEYHVPWVDQSLYSLKLKVINCFII